MWRLNIFISEGSSSSLPEFIFNLENIYYFPSCSGGMISLHHSFTPSLGHFPLDIWKRELPYEKAADARQKIWI